MSSPQTELAMLATERVALCARIDGLRTQPASAERDAQIWAFEENRDLLDVRVDEINRSLLN